MTEVESVVFFDHRILLNLRQKLDTAAIFEALKEKDGALDSNGKWKAFVAMSDMKQQTLEEAYNVLADIIKAIHGANGIDASEAKLNPKLDPAHIHSSTACADGSVLSHATVANMVLESSTPTAAPFIFDYNLLTDLESMFWVAVWTSLCSKFVNPN